MEHLFTYVKDKIHDASGIDNPKCYMWIESANGVWYPTRKITQITKEETQLDLQLEIVEKTGINIVSCGNCGTIVLHRIEDEVIYCFDCGFESDPCDFPDLNY